MKIHKTNQTCTLLVACNEIVKVLTINECLNLQGLVSEFETPKAEDPTLEKYQFQWLYANGLLGIIFCFSLLYTALRSRSARSWKYGTGL